MRYAISTVFKVVAMLCAALGSSLALAQSANPLLWAVSMHGQQQLFETQTNTYQCPQGSIPISFSFVTRNPATDLWQEIDRSLIDTNGTKFTWSSLTSLDQLNGAGLSQTLYNINCHGQQFEAAMTCMSVAASTDNKPVLAQVSTQTARTLVGVATTFCPADHPVAVAGFSNADGLLLQDLASAPVWGTSANPIFLADVPDGTMGPPTGWQAQVVNQGNVTAVTGYAVCAQQPSVQTFVYSVPAPELSFGFTPFSAFSPVPDGYTALGVGYDGGQYGHFTGSDFWTGDGTVVSMLQWFANVSGSTSIGTEIRAFNEIGYGNAPTDATNRAVTAVLAIPAPTTPPTTATIVEYYNAALDHYFITANPQEMSDLDTGVHVGWARTGQSFNGYAIGSTGGADRRPVCRIYGLPTAGIDSHFYSASLDECTQTMATFGDGWQRPGSWEYESSEVFEMDLPDPVTGACPAGDVPVYRVFNQRTDANHRYTTSIAIRDQMVAEGGVAEGYGPNAVDLCALQ